MWVLDMSQHSDNHEDTTDVVCPHCGYIDREWFEGYDISDGSVGTHECMDCSKPFKLHVSISVNFTTERLTHEEVSLEEIEEYKKRYAYMEEILNEDEKSRMQERLAEKIERHEKTDWSEVDE